MQRRTGLTTKTLLRLRYKESGTAPSVNLKLTNLASKYFHSCSNCKLWITWVWSVREGRLGSHWTSTGWNRKTRPTRPTWKQVRILKTAYSKSHDHDLEESEVSWNKRLRIFEHILTPRQHHDELSTWLVCTRHLCGWAIPSGEFG